ncbi:LOW QUALITY PROTEIN: uncharacterized protein LOC108087163 [Drosophila ficusphila]|uniref:LOW QUALITY PROTEIN: uncharacterized protein LOC108087163 n=1 Tax=Drosophila ficusphila TaxID=30025 RepID=UPI0007E7BA7F|nr:LOW QUALITY PROTEIN: uncharacterized protein LOC108087163 [Drosophila ficusphila]
MNSNKSGVKHFDRKFVASNLQSLLRCPKCAKSYTFLYNRSKNEESFRPILLPCGHNLCESCAWKNRKDLKCAECQTPAPPTIKVKDPSSQFAVNVRDYYELNFHVLGEASSLTYYRRFASETSNNSLSLSSGSEVIVQSTKCSECGNAVATGECRQCNAFYCRRCFEAVHNHSRVLKSHIFQKTPVEEQTQSSKGLRVGKDFFTLPSNDCNYHLMPRNLYCLNCKRTSCQICTSLQHRGHHIRQLAEINQRYASEIPVSLNSLNSTLLNIQNGKEVVRAAKQKLSDYASETLASVSKRFCHLHGLLQVAELQVIEKLRESSLPPQMELNEAMGKLSGYESLIKRLKETLESGSEDNMGVPRDIVLKWLLKLIAEHIEKIPTTVQVSKIEENPYRLAFGRMLDMTNILKCDFIDPKIQVRFRSDFDTKLSVSISTNEPVTSRSSSSGKENIHQPNIKSPQMMLTPNLKTKPISQNQKKRAKKNQTFQSSLSSFAAATEDLNLAQSLSTLDITKPNVSPVVKAGKAADWFKTDALVRVRSVNSPEDFYVQGIHAAHRLREELDTFANSMSGRRSSPLAVVVGQHYIAYHKDQERYFRAMVSQKLAARDTYKIFLPDIGVFVETHSSNFYDMPERLAHLPYSTVHCSLRELMPNHGGSEWDTRASAFLKQIVQNNPVHVIVKKALSPDLHEVDLITNNYNTEISVRESFLYSGLARSRCDRASALGQQWLQPAPSSLRLPRMKFQFGDVLMIQMLHVEDPQEFYVMRHDFESKRCMLQSNLQGTMDRINISQLQNIFLGRLHLGCVLQSDGQWKRASIEQILPDGYVFVRLVDDGPSQKVFWDQLFVLPQNFCDTELAIKCCLADVETRPELGYVWTPEATAYFKQLTSNPKLHMEVIRSTGDVVYVALTFTRSDTEITSVGVQLVEQEYCTSSGESSRKNNSTHAPRFTSLDVETRKFIEQQKGQPVELTPYQKPDKNDRNKRVNVYILYVRQPDEFYVTLPHFQAAIDRLQKSVQESAAAFYQDMQPRTNWQLGEMCYVKVQAKYDSQLLWHRGVVTKVIPPGSSFQSIRYQVQLRDLGEMVENVSSDCLANIDEANKRISNSAKRCHLHGIRSTIDGWSEDAIDFFKDQLQAYDDIYVTGHGCKENSLSVVLWGSHTVISGPFSPARLKYVNINKTLLLAGMAEKDPNTDQEDQQSMMDNASIRSVATTNSCDVKAIKSYMDKIDKMTKANDIHTVEPSKVQIGFEHNDEMPPLKLLEDLGRNKPTTGQTVPPAGWTTPRKCEKTIFTAIATNVSYDCGVYLTLANDKPFIEHMRNLLVKNYKSLMEKQQQRCTLFTYEVGQAVVVTYHMDNCFYRGIVQRMRNNHDEYTVYYVDYGNMEQVKADEMLPYAPFPELNAMCFPVTIHGVRSKRGEYSVKEMDTVHQSLVMKLSSVRIVDAQGAGSKKPPTCQIKVGNVDIATMMIDSEIAISTVTQPSKKKLMFMPPTKALEEFKVFEELEQLASVQGDSPDEEAPQVQRKNESMSSVQQPPTKKKYHVNSKEVEAFEQDQDQDFDCQQAAQEMHLNNSFYFTVNKKYDSKSCAEESVLDDSEDERSSNCSENKMMKIDDDCEDSQMEPLSFPAADQLRRRIELRQKEMKANVSFSPLETSTVRSYYNASSSFKTLSLPNGVKEFQCTVESVLSATELQISPCLSEFTKHDINLVQETRVLIKDAELLKNPKLGDLCLARYSKDKQWYRAIIKEIPPATPQATVFYIDFHDTERVFFNHLKVMPNQLFMFPLRSFRVKLHGVKKNKNFTDKSVRQALQASLCKFALVFARVHYPLNYHSKNSEGSDGGSDLIEVELFENRQKKKPVYQPLFENWMFLKKTKN